MPIQQLVTLLFPSSVECSAWNRMPHLNLTVTFCCQLSSKFFPFFDTLANLSLKMPLCLLSVPPVTSPPSLSCSQHNPPPGTEGWFGISACHPLWAKQWQNILPFLSIMMSLCFSYARVHEPKGQSGAAGSSWRAHIHLVRCLMP